ncbi:hypothetical protein ACKKBF_B38325 [Auxenochlorella protothecoides x Auxenochlorella symbiontica]|uniref:Uncharacterized protein n=3 Tax=Auxenochlorella protothecoides TaxID=3075 RepID=A0A1D2A5B7_AUXPR
MQVRLAPSNSAPLMPTKADPGPTPGTPLSVVGLADGVSIPSTASVEEGSLVASSRSSDVPTGEASGSGTSSGRDGDAGPASPIGRPGGSEAFGRGSPPSTSEEIPHVDVDFVVRRLSCGSLPLTGQVVAYGWEQAAMLASTCKAMPNQLFTALWPATAACLDTFSSQSILDMLTAWSLLQQRCPRHFRLSSRVVESMVQRALPPIVKRLRDSELADMAELAQELASQGLDPGVVWFGPSSRDLLCPVFSLVAVEAAWRDLTPGYWLHRDARARVLAASRAWSWRAVPHRDSGALTQLKGSVECALGVLRRADSALCPPPAGQPIADPGEGGA